MPARTGASADGGELHYLPHQHSEPEKPTSRYRDPIVVIACMLAPPSRGRLTAPHILGAHAPVKKPSTASIGDIRRAAGIMTVLFRKGALMSDQRNGRRGELRSQSCAAIGLIGALGFDEE